MLAIREAVASDAPLIVEMIRELAEFERQLDQVEITPEDLLRDGFGDNPRFQALVAEWDGKPAAYALYYFTYSTWTGRSGMFLEDLFVREQFRGKGIGKALLQRVAAAARSRNCDRMRWEVLTWNTVAIEFYRSLGATLPQDWFSVHFDGRAFEDFASGKNKSVDDASRV
jgi:GNAT superfamily N-acetyltransferase